MQSCLGFVMFWAGFGWQEKTNTLYLNGCMNAKDFQNLLHDHLLPVPDKIGKPLFMFQQDNFRIHAVNFMFRVSNRWYVHYCLACFKSGFKLHGKYVRNTVKICIYTSEKQNNSTNKKKLGVDVLGSPAVHFK